MLIVSLKNIEKSYGDKVLYFKVALDIRTGDRIAVVGDNGSGKSTLLDMIAGESEPDQGEIKTWGRIAYLRQYSGTKAKGIEAGKDYSGYNGAIFGVEAKPYSGGEEVRAMLAEVFSRPAELILFDEPTANLDVGGIEVLQSMLQGLETFVLVSHDIRLISSVSNCIADIDGGDIKLYRMGYAEYKEAKRLELGRKREEYGRYTDEKKRLTQAIKERESAAARIKKAPSRMGNSEARLHKREAQQKAAKIHGAAEAMKSRLMLMGEVERPIDKEPIKLRFGLIDPPASRYVVTCKGLRWGYEGGEDIFDGADFEVLNGSKVAVVGGNGSGKSTLLNLIVNRPDLIYRVPKLKIGVMRQAFDNIDFGKTVIDIASENAVVLPHICRQVLYNMGFDTSALNKRAGHLSGGELVKLSLVVLLTGDYNMLVLDEPTNYLDINSIGQVTSALKDYGGTVMMASHDRAFVAQVADTVLILLQGKINITRQ